MKKEKNNFTRAVEWLKTHGVVKDQNDMAERMDVTTTTISRNKHGSVKRPDDETLRKFNEQFGDIINIAYLRGESKVMLVSDLRKREAMNTGFDTTAALLATKEEVIAELRKRLAGTIADKNEIIAGLKCELEAKDKTVAANEALIKNLQQTVARLTADLAMEKGLSTGRSHSASADTDHRPRKEV